MNMSWTYLGEGLRQSDLLRRSFGTVLDSIGLGPSEVPYDAVLIEPGYTLRRYRGAGDGRAPVLIVPAPIKRPYIFDLRPGRSVVQRFLEAGFSVYLIAWKEAGPEGADWGLSEYAGSWIAAAVERMRSEQRRTPILVGHSLGGTFAALYAALDPGQISKLVLVEAPLAFGKHTGALASIVAMSPRTWQSAHLLGGAPGSLLDLASVTADPEELVLKPLLDRWWSVLDSNAMATHTRVMRWSLDEFPLPPRLFAEVVELLYREDRFARGELTLSGQPAEPAALNTVRIAAIVDGTSRLVPGSSVLAPLTNPVVFRYEPEIGVALQHVGPLVGQRAHRELWPQVISWMQE